METIAQDLAYATRILRKSPAFTAVIVLTLALGIGADTAVFSIVQSVLLRPLPYRDPSRLVLTFAAPAHNRETKIFVPYRQFQGWASRNRSYVAMAAETWIRGPRFMLGRGAAQSILAVPVTLDFFSVLGVTPQTGRVFNRDDLSRGCTAVLSHQFWQNRLGAQTNIVGQRLTLDESSCTVIGVMPPSFVFFPAPTDMWTLIAPGTELDRNPDRNGVAVIGRLKPGVSMAAAEAELRTLTHTIDQGRGFGVEIEPVSFDLQEEFTWLAGRTLRLSILVLFGAVSLVLLIACVNVANLLLGRLLSRRRELAIRTALGSSRTRLIRQLLTESLLLGVSAALLGAGLAAGAVYAFRVSNPVELPPGGAPGLNIAVLSFTLGLALATTLVFGLVPAWDGSRTSVGEALKSGGRSSAGISRQRLARGLVTAEITLSLVLLAGAGMLIRSVVNFASMPLGFDTDRLITMTVGLPPAADPAPEQRAALYDRMRRGILTLPGVEGAGMTTHLGLKGGGGVSVIAIEDRPPADPKRAIFDTELQYVTDGYFRFLGIPFRRGREFAWADRGQSLAVAVVNSALVRKYFPGEDPLGKRIRFPGTGDSKDAGQWLTIVGLAGDEKRTATFQEMAWTDPLVVYRPLAQQPEATVDLVVRVASLQTMSASTIQQEVLKAGPDIRVSDVHPLQYILDTKMANPRFRAILMGAFAGLALVLALVGLYGVLSQLVAQRTQEIGIRMALGAQRKDVLGLILKQGLLVAGAGTGLGLLAAAWLGRFLQSLLYGVRPEDPATLAGVSMLLILAALLGPGSPPAARLE